jgi:hypothetical protein
VPLLRKVAQSAVVLAAAAGLMALGTWGTFEDPNTPLRGTPITSGTDQAAP